MSSINIRGILENHSKRIGVYTPIIEGIVNAINAIESVKRTDGEIVVRLFRDSQGKLLDTEALAPFVGLEIQDNGIGFTQANIDSFDRLYSEMKADQGGKGFGRFTFLKYFEFAEVESIAITESLKKKITFTFGTDNSRIVDRLKKEDIEDQKIEIGTIVRLKNLKQSKVFLPEKNIETIARNIAERILIYFVDVDYSCPKIILEEASGKRIILNELVSTRDDAEIREVHSASFRIDRESKFENFDIKIFKIFSPTERKNSVILSAHNREVTTNLLKDYNPDFADIFIDKVSSKANAAEKIDMMYSVKAYVSGNYLDENVSLERESFDFVENENLYYPIGKSEIEKKAAEIVSDYLGDHLRSRRAKKIAQVRKYVSREAPWNASYLDDLDYEIIPYNPSHEDIEKAIHSVKFRKEQGVRKRLESIKLDSSVDMMKEASDLMKDIGEAERSQLAHYVSFRRIVLDLLKKSLAIRNNGKFELEQTVHNIIFPIKKDSEEVEYLDHNLWILDERLNTADYISSDKPIKAIGSDRCDLVIFDKRIVMRTGDSQSNPVTIFEFKRPGREDFVNESSQEDPVSQIIRYVCEIEDGKFSTRQGRPINVASSTPFFGYVICDLTPKIKNWLKDIKDFTILPDGEGAYKWHTSKNLYIEVISWDKLLKGAEMRNNAFFSRLGINTD